MTQRQSGHADSTITVNLDAIVANWRFLDSLSAPSTKTAAMVKANGYGLDSGAVATALAAAGCPLFFVASLGEAIELRQHFNKIGINDIPIMVLHGAQIGQEDALAANQLVPVLNDLEQISRWRLFADKTGMTLPALLHFDTGMTRLGLDGDQTDWLIQNRGALDGLDIAYVMSHLVSGELADDPVNARQLTSFNELRSWFAGVPASLANSAGCMLGKDYHFQMTRPGIALYGVHPLETRIPNLQPVFDWQARILQIRQAAAGDRVGYGGTFELQRQSRIATIGVGYADGYRRQLGGKATVSIGGKTAPVIGRISMDSITVDVTDLDQNSLRADQAALIHGAYPIEAMAVDLGTISYEIMTTLGQRADWHYHGGCL